MDEFGIVCQRGSCSGAAAYLSPRDRGATRKDNRTTSDISSSPHCGLGYPAIKGARRPPLCTTRWLGYYFWQMHPLAARSPLTLWLVQGQMGRRVLADHAARADQGAGGWRRRSKACFRRDDDDDEDRRRCDREGAARLSTAASSEMVHRRLAEKAELQRHWMQQ
jgi:hypothetical protein